MIMFISLFMQDEITENNFEHIMTIGQCKSVLITILAFDANFPVSK